MDTPEPLRRCCTCKVVKPTSDFGWNNRARGLLQKYCRDCKRAYNRAWYRQNRAKQMADVQRTNRLRKTQARALVRTLKDQPCMDCGGRFPPEAMDFDHVRGVKTATISWLANQGCVLSRLLEEIAKCELVCSNCHRIRTVQRLAGGRQRRTEPDQERAEPTPGATGAPDSSVPTLF